MSYDLRMAGNVQTSLPARTPDAHGPFLLTSQPELQSFNQVKTALLRNTSLVHYSPTRHLCINFDVSADGIGVVVYHVTEKALRNNTYNGETLTI